MRSSTSAMKELPLRQIFDDVCPTFGASAQHATFAEMIDLFAKLDIQYILQSRNCMFLMIQFYVTFCMQYSLERIFYFHG